MGSTTESGSCLFDLAQITNLGNISGNELNTLRQQTGADLVSLIITDGDCAGIAYVLSNSTGSPNAAYSVTALNTTTSQLTFAHEIGHNLGAAHDGANSGTVPGLFPYSYGYQNTTVDPFFRDLMSYECAGAPCPRQPYFSNPNVRVFGRPTGVVASAPNSADLAATFALSSPVVANYRPRNPNPDPTLVPVLSALPRSTAVPRAGGTYTVTVRATTPWLARTGDSWIPVGEVTGTGDAEIVVRVPPNNAIGNRSGQILFSPADNRNSIITQANFTQEGVQATFSPSSTTTAAGPVSCQTRLTLSDESFSWTAAPPPAGQNWFSFSPSSGTGSTTITYSAAANPSTTFRSGGISLGNGAGFGFGQYNYVITPNAAAVTLPAAGGSATIPVSPNPDFGHWMATAFSSDQWLTATPNPASQFQTLATFTATRNLSSADRFGTLTIGSETIPVRQLGQRCTLSTPISLGAILINAQLSATPACGSSYLRNTPRAAYTNRYTFPGTAGQTVRILMESGVLDSVLYLTGTNNELLTQDDNSGGSNNAAIPNLTNFFVLPSTGTYTIEATSFSLGAFTLRLLGSTPATATLVPASLTVAPTVGTGTLALTIAPGLAWSATASSADEWLQVSPTTGTGNATLSYKYFPNPSTTARTATIQAAGQTVTLTQSAAPPEVLPPFTFGTPPLTGPGTRDTGPLYSVADDSKHVYRFTHPAGFASLNVVNVLINTALDGGSACYIAYSRPAGVLYLVDDAGPDAGLTALTLGSNATVSNSQCTIHGADSSAVGSGNHLTLTLRIEFKPAFAGYRVAYLAARDYSGGNSGWITHGGIAIPDLPATFPRSGPIQPSSGQAMQPFILKTAIDPHARAGSAALPVRFG